MKSIKNIKWTLLVVPVISVFSFVTILTAAPATVTEKMNTQEIQTIAVISPDIAKKALEPQANPDSKTVPVNSSTRSTTTTVPTPVPAKPKSVSTPVRNVQPQPSRSTSKPSTPSKSTPSKPSSKASTIIATSKQYIGVKYVYGGTTPAGFDCSGFVKYVFAKNGITLPRVSRDQFKVGTPVSFSNLRPGDLVFFSISKNGVVDHDGIYIGNGQFINASSSKGVTIYTLGPYWKSVYVGAKRVL